MKEQTTIRLLRLNIEYSYCRPCVALQRSGLLDLKIAEMRIRGVG